MKKNKIKLIIYILLLFCYAEVSYSQTAIVVNENNPIDDISIYELRQIYLGQKTILPNGKNIVLAEYADLKETFYEILLNWSLLKFKKHWMGLIFSNRNSVAPKEFKRYKELKDFITSEEGAVAFIELTEIDNNVKVLTINGKKPGSKDYPLQK